MHLFCGDGFNIRRVASLVPRGPDLMGERRPIRLEALEEPEGMLAFRATVVASMATRIRLSRQSVRPEGIGRPIA